MVVEEEKDFRRSQIFLKVVELLGRRLPLEIYRNGCVAARYL